MPGPAAKTKHQILYARQLFKDMRWILFAVAIVYVGIGVFQAYFSSPRHPQELVTYAASVVFPMFLALVLYANSLINYVEFDDAMLVVHTSFRRVRIPYTEVEKARLDTIEHFFERPERKRMRTQTVRHLYKARALCLKVRDNEDVEARLKRGLGRRIMLDREVILPLEDPDGALATMRARLSQRRADSRADAPSGPAGGRRRGRKGRR